LQFINDKYVPKFEPQVREAEKKVLLLMAGPLRGGRVEKAGPLSSNGHEAGGVG